MPNNPERNPRSHDNRRRAESFGADPLTYDRIRPTYPDAMFDFLLDGRTPDVLDVGCGTGILSRSLISRGATVLGLEIDGRMAAIARASGIEVQTSAFEDWDASGRTFELITCGQAWHWIEPVTGARQAAALLRDGGRLALLWNFVQPTARQHQALQPVYSRIAPDLNHSVLLGSGPEGLGQHVRDLDESGRFRSVERHEFPWQHMYERDEWLALLGTHSDHHTLPPDIRAQLLAAVGDAIDSLGGTLTMAYRTVLLLTERR